MIFKFIFVVCVRVCFEGFFVCLIMKSTQKKKFVWNCASCHCKYLNVIPFVVLYTAFLTNIFSFQKFCLIRLIREHLATIWIFIDLYCNFYALLLIMCFFVCVCGSIETSSPKKQNFLVQHICLFVLDFGGVTKWEWKGKMRCLYNQKLQWKENVIDRREKLVPWKHT